MHRDGSETDLRRSRLCVAAPSGQRSRSQSRKFLEDLAGKLVGLIREGGGTPPVEVAHLWGWFWTLAARRTSGGMGAPNPITFSEIDAWARLMGVTPRPWEVVVLARMDDAWRQKVSQGESGSIGEGPDAVKALMMSLPGPRRPKASARAAGAGGNAARSSAARTAAAGHTSASPPPGA